ncbi:MAG: hypothetical protein JXP34_09775 [Planctomycetes bacterium]|nr:hypothetical protein [Planctomycetota bacterium]
MKQCSASAALAGVVALAIPAGAYAAAPRDEILLDGEWGFRLDPEGEGEGGNWATSAEGLARIRVPGAWDAQGFGEEHRKLRNHYEGLAWYIRDAEIPAGWAGGRIFLSIGGVHRAAAIFIDGRRAGEHRGYAAPFEVEVTDLAKPGGTARIAILVDSRRDPALDGLVGAQDLIDYVETSWGGIHRSVRLERRPRIFIRDVFAIPRVAEKAVVARIEIAGEDTEGLSIRATAIAGGGEEKSAEAPASPRLDIRIPADHLPLWSPETPALSTLRVEMRRGSEPLDRVEIRFGFREIEIRGNDFFLNGRRLFLRGFGDDSCYPMTLAPPADIAYYRRVLSIARDYGFIFTRFHSAVPVEEYFRAADEIGILVKPELPIAYLNFYSKAPEARKLYLASWEAIVRSRRNHPSVFCWCFGNEQWNGIDLAPDLYRMAKELDPTRPVIDTSGLWRDVVIREAASGLRPTLDFLTVYLDEAGSFPWGREKDKNALGGVRPAKPVLGHEFGNYATFPRLEKAARYTGGMRPFWFAPWIENAKARGLSPEDLAALARASENLQALSHKLNVESARLNPEIDGYDLWLVQDYWTVNQGLLDQFYEPKAIDAAAARKWNGPSVLLIDRDRATYWEGETIRVKAYVSRFDGAERIEGRLVAAVDGPSVYRKYVPVTLEGAGLLGPVAEIEIPARLSDPRPAKVVLRLRLRAGALDIENDWPFWIFPRRESPPSGEGGVIVSRRPTDELLAKVRAGGRALVLSADGLFREIPARFKPAWWAGSGGDRNLGLVVRDHPALGDFPHEGWGDLHFYWLADRRPQLILDGDLASTRPIIQGIDLPAYMETKAVLATFKLGEGEIVFATMDLGAEAVRERPECRAMRESIVRYLAAGDADPNRPILPEDRIARWIRARPHPEGAVLAEGFAEIVEATNEPIDHASARSPSIRSWFARALDGKHLVRWRTAPAPDAEVATFVLFAGLGWRSQPAASFALDIAGRPVFRFDVPNASTAWDGEVPGARLVFRILSSNAEDGLGLLFITLPRELRPAGKPVEVTVRGNDASSRRWFMIQDERDAVGFWRGGE